VLYFERLFTVQYVIEQVNWVVYFTALFIMEVVYLVQTRVTPQNVLKKSTLSWLNPVTVILIRFY